MSTRFGMYLQEKDHREKQEKLKKYFNPSPEIVEASQRFIEQLKTMPTDYPFESNFKLGSDMDEGECTCEKCKCKGDKEII